MLYLAVIVCLAKTEKALLKRATSAASPCPAEKATVIFGLKRFVGANGAPNCPLFSL